MKRTFALCHGRHDIISNTGEKIINSIFENTIEDPTDINFLDSIVREKLQGITSLELYITGLTVALIAVINYCNTNNIELMLYHYDIVSKKYFQQKIK